jgi:hypothetical protein
MRAIEPPTTLSAPASSAAPWSALPTPWSTSRHRPAADYDLHAADAIHLATALAVTEADSLPVTWDKRLRLAAVQAGLASAPAHS